MRNSIIGIDRLNNNEKKELLKCLPKKVFGDEHLEFLLGFIVFVKFYRTKRSSKILYVYLHLYINAKRKNIPLTIDLCSNNVVIE